MAQFKVGDRVRAIRDCDGTVEKGMFGTIRGFSKWNPPVGVEWDSLTDGHDGNGCAMKCERGKGYYVKEADIELLRLPSIHITTDGKTTHAVLKEGGKVSKRAKAICSPHDEFDFETGARIAFDRLIGSDVGIPTTETVREVKRPAKVGEYIKIVDPKYNATYTINDYVKGDIKCVLKTWGSGASFESNSKTASGNAHVWHEEYVVLEGYTPEPEKPTYYNGKVVCVDASLGFTPGKVYAFKDGMTVDDDGDVRPGDWRLEKLEDYLPTNRFIEYKGEA